jgi:hypothetical protein
MLAVLLAAFVAGGSGVKATPTPEHARLASLVGTWDVELSLWWKPNESATKARGISVIKPLYGGIFVEERIEALIGEQPLGAFAVLGYDAGAKRFVATRLMSSETRLVAESGTFDDKAGALVFTTTPSPDGVSERTVIRQASAGEIHLERWLDKKGAPPWKTLEVRYERRPE